MTEGQERSDPGSQADLAKPLAAGLNQTLAVLASMIGPPLFSLFVDQTE